VTRTELWCSVHGQYTGPDYAPVTHQAFHQK